MGAPGSIEGRILMRSVSGTHSEAVTISRLKMARTRSLRQPQRSRYSFFPLFLGIVGLDGGGEVFKM
jgi:hypothetical protein